MNSMGEKNFILGGISCRITNLNSPDHSILLYISLTISRMEANLAVSDVKVFVPAKDFQQALAFYQALGWKVLANHGQLAELELGTSRFYLQDYYHKGWAENFMLYINVEDVNVWYAHIQQVLASGNFPSARVKAPALQDHGDTVCYVWDPSGVLLHFAG